MSPMDFPDGHYPYRGSGHQNHQQRQQQQQQQHRRRRQEHQQEAEAEQEQQHQDQDQDQRAHPSISYPHYPVRPQQLEAFYHQAPHAEYADYSSIAPDHEDFEGCSEISTRPRLTKEQVDVLETQFQAHPKPNSNVKRQLALQTKLTLPRVANWFQNRRAKAKQMRKQEEFEITKGAGIAEAWNEEHHVPTGYTIPLQINTTAVSSSRSLPSVSPDGGSQPSATLPSAETSAGRDGVQEASWASLQRALNAANTARSQYVQEPQHTFASLPCRDHQQHPSPLSLPRNHSQGWSNTSLTSDTWNISSQHPEDGDFDFGFAAQPFDQLDAAHDIEQSQMDSPDDIPGFAISADVWTAAVTTPTINAHALHGSVALHQSDPLPMPHFPSSRRASSSDELTSTLGQFVLAGTPPLVSPASCAQGEQFKKSEQNIDIAARRKRPRPPPLGTAALRSHSYGSQSAMSPTLRFGRPTQNSHSIRHVKSMGQNLNVKYAGIRKPSSAQRSPLNIATFAEAEEFSNLIAERKLPQHLGPENAGAPPTPICSEDIVRTRLPGLEESIFTEEEQDRELPHQYFLSGQPSQFSMASPPSTPMKPDFFHAPQMQSMMPPLSAPPQYAIFPDYTPPYSAGPFTAGSWSDAPLTSPEMATFPPASYVPQQRYISPVMHEYNSGPPFQHHFAAQPRTERKQRDVSPPANHNQKQTEFFIQEFPRQKEEHAHAAQQMAQQKPKNYVFANATPSDF